MTRLQRDHLMTVKAPGKPKIDVLMGVIHSACIFTIINTACYLDLYICNNNWKITLTITIINSSGKMFL